VAATSHLRNNDGGLVIHTPAAQCAIATIPVPPTPQNPLDEFCSSTPKCCANSVIHPTTGIPQEYQALCTGPDGDIWTLTCTRYIGCLACGIDSATNDHGTKIFRFIAHTALSSDRHATYLCIIVAKKTHKEEKQRMHFSWGGNLVDYPGVVSTPSHRQSYHSQNSFQQYHLHPRCQIHDSRQHTFYLNTPMPQPEYMQIPVPVVPDIILTNYKLQQGLIHNGHILVETNKGMHSLPQAGCLAYD
jgi:hypothetical protein